MPPSAPSHAPATLAPPQGELSQADVAALARGTAPGARALPTAAIASGAPFAQAHGAIAAFALTEAGRERPGSVALNSAPPEHRAPGVARFTFPAPGLTMEGANGLPVVRGELVIGYTPREVTKEEEARSDEQSARWAEDVRNAMRHAWSGYRTYAWGRDELKPQSKVGADPWGGIGCTLVDALDTLWLMGLRSEFEEAARWAKEKLTFAHAGTVSTFETTIRELGGLLAAHDLSGDAGLLARAEEIGSKLVRAFDGGTMPSGQVDLRSGRGGAHGWSGGSAVLAEVGTLQVEFRYLAAKTGKAEYAAKANRVFEVLSRQHPAHGLYPIYVRNDGGMSGQVTFGALGDSFYEYLLKMWIQGGKVETHLRRMYDAAMDGVVSVLLQRSSPSGLAYLGDYDGGRIVHKMDHLACFIAGTLALGAHTSPDGLRSARAQRDLLVAKAVCYTCYEMYARMPTGIAPEYVTFNKNGGGAGADFSPGASAGFYILRPETVESLFVLHQLTRDPIYREWSRKIFEAIEKHCKTSVGYGALPDVRSSNRRPDDRMESFFLAETLKYLYLIQDPHHPIDIVNGYVFNTEAHPLRILGGSGVHISQQLSAG